MIKNRFLSIGLLSGTIIGAGVFSLPYIFKTSGIFTGIFYLVLAVVTFYFVLSMYAEIVSKTPGEHRFVGYAKIYLGKWVSWLAILVTIIGMILVLTVYLVLSQSFAQLITSFGAPIEKMIVFWFLGSVAVFMTARRLAWLEFSIAIGMIAIFALIFVFGIPELSKIPTGDFLPKVGSLFIPLGAILFSLSGRVAIPPLVRLGGPVKKSILIGLIIPAVVYVVFVLSVLGLSLFVTEDAVSGLIGQVPAWVLFSIGVLGILSLITSYIAISFDVVKSLALDLRLPFWLQFLIIVFGPLALYFAGLQSFIGLVGLAGGVFLALESIFMIFIWLKMKDRKLTLPVTLLVLVFVAAFLSQLLK